MPGQEPNDLIPGVASRTPPADNLRRFVVRHLIISSLRRPGSPRTRTQFNSITSRPSGNCTTAAEDRQDDFLVAEGSCAGSLGRGARGRVSVHRLVRRVRRGWVRFRGMCAACACSQREESCHLFHMMIRFKIRMYVVPAIDARDARGMGPVDAVCARTSQQMSGEKRGSDGERLWTDRRHISRVSSAVMAGKGFGAPRLFFVPSCVVRCARVPATTPCCDCFHLCR